MDLWQPSRHGTREGRPFKDHLYCQELLDGKRPHLPATLLPYFQAQKRAAGGQTESLF